MLGPILLGSTTPATVYVPRVSKEPVDGDRQTLRDVENFPATLRVDPATLTAHGDLRGTRVPASGTSSRPTTGRPGSIWSTTSGTPVYLVDPGINGTHRYTADGQRQVAKFDAPKATLMSYIIKGILNRQLPWGLVLLGVMIALVLEMSGIPSLAFAVGVYLPLSSSSPIFIGGMVRWLGDLLRARASIAGRNLTEEQLDGRRRQEPRRAAGSGYIAGGAIAGILIAFMAGVTARFHRRITRWSAANNPFFAGPSADLLSMIPFALLMVLLYLVGREVILAPRKSARR